MQAPLKLTIWRRLAYVSFRIRTELNEAQKNHCRRQPLLFTTLLPVEFRHRDRRGARAAQRGLLDNRFRFIDDVGSNGSGDL